MSVERTEIADDLNRLLAEEAEVLNVEPRALDAYKRFLPRVGGDPVLEDFIRKQIAVETEHVQEIKQLLE